MKKSDTKGQILYNYTYMRYLQQSNSQRQTVQWWLQGAGVGVERVTEGCLMGAEFQFGKMKTLWRWMMVMSVQQCECT